MLLVNRRRRCLEEGCLRQPLYGKDSDRVPLACGAHRSPTMVNVTHRRCAEVREGKIKRVTVVVVVLLVLVVVVVLLVVVLVGCTRDSACRRPSTT